MLKNLLKKRSTKAILLAFLITAIGGVLSLLAYGFYDWGVLGWDIKETLVDTGMKIFCAGLILFYVFMLIFLERWWVKMLLCYFVIFSFIISTFEFFCEGAGCGQTIVFSGFGIAIASTVIISIHQLVRFLNYKPLILFVILLIIPVLLLEFLFKGAFLEKDFINFLPGENNFCTEQANQAQEKIASFKSDQKFSEYLPVWEKLFKKANNISDEFFEENIFISNIYWSGHQALWVNFYLKNNELYIGGGSASIPLMKEYDGEKHEDPEDWLSPEEILKEGLKAIKNKNYKLNPFTGEENKYGFWRIEEPSLTKIPPKLPDLDCEYIVDRIYDCNYIPFIPIPTGRDWSGINWAGLGGLSIDLRSQKKTPLGREDSATPFIGFTLDLISDELWCFNGKGNAERNIYRN